MNQEIPHSLETEEIVLGSLLLDSNSFYIVSNILSPDCFYKTENKYVFEAISKLCNSGKKADSVTVTDLLHKNKQLKMIGGPLFISKLTDRIASTANIEVHSMILREKSIKRQQIAFGNLLIQKGYDEGEDPIEVSDWASEMIFKIATMTNLSTSDTNMDVAKEIIQDIYEAGRSGGLVGIKTGFTQQDEILGGYQAPNMIVNAARPGMGKTAKMICEAYYIAVVLNIPVLIFSLEMSRKELFKRFGVIHAKIGSWIYRQKGLDKDYTKRFEQQLYELAEKNIIIDDTPAITPNYMRNRAKKEIVKKGVKILFLDYIQLMTGEGKETTAQISYCSRKIKEIAKELHVPIVALAQVGRSVTTRGDREPQLSDLKGSGSIEEDADIVEFIHRPPYYDENANDKKEAYFIIAKHRNGSLARMEVRYLHDRAQFVNPGEDVYRFEDDEKKEKDDLPF